MTDDPQSGNNDSDLKRKFGEALERKQQKAARTGAPNEQGQNKGNGAGKGGGQKRLYRRKTG